MNLIESSDLLKASEGLNRFGGSFAAKMVMHIMRLNKINKLYSDVYDEDPNAFLDRLINALGVTIEINAENSKGRGFYYYIQSSFRRIGRDYSD